MSLTSWVPWSSFLLDFWAHFPVTPPDSLQTGISMPKTSTICTTSDPFLQLCFPCVLSIDQCTSYNELSICSSRESLRVLFPKSKKKKKPPTRAPDIMLEFISISGEFWSFLLILCSLRVPSCFPLQLSVLPDVSRVTTVLYSHFFISLFPYDFSSFSHTIHNNLNYSVLTAKPIVPGDCLIKWAHQSIERVFLSKIVVLVVRIIGWWWW